MTLGSPVLGPVGSRQRVILWIFNRIKLFSGTLPTVYLFYVILRTHRHKNFKSLLPYVVFLKLSLCATLHEDAVVQAIVFRQRVSFSSLWKSVWIWLFMRETYFWRINGPSYRKCIVMYPYFRVLFVARKLFKKWRQPWFPFARARWFFKILAVFIHCHVAKFDFLYFCTWNKTSFIITVSFLIWFFASAEKVVTG